MPQLVKFQSDSAVSNYTPESGYGTLIVSHVNGTTSLKVKNHDGQIKQVGGGAGYNRKIVSAAATLSNADWALVDTDCTVTLPSATVGYYVAVSTVGDADNVIVAPASGQTVQGDAQGVTLDQKRLKVQLYCGTAGNWTIAEVK